MAVNKPSDNKIFFFGVLGLVFAFFFKFIVGETFPNVQNVSGFLQIVSSVLLSYFGAQKRKKRWKSMHDSPKARHTLQLRSVCVFVVTYFLLLLFYEHPIISWLLETGLSIVLGILVSISDIIDSPMKMERCTRRRRHRKK